MISSHPLFQVIFVALRIPGKPFWVISAFPQFRRKEFSLLKNLKVLSTGMPIVPLIQSMAVLITLQVWVFIYGHCLILRLFRFNHPESESLLKPRDVLTVPKEVLLQNRLSGPIFKNCFK